MSVGRFGPGATTGTTATDFTFDENAFVTGVGALHVILTDGTDVACTAPEVGTTNTTNPGGGTTAGGNGTVTITVLCNNPGGALAGGTGAGTALTAANVARGVVEENTVSDLAQTTAVVGIDPGGNENPLQASNTPDLGTTDPDLVSAEFRPGTTADAVDQVIYTFDEPLVVAGTGAPAQANFLVYELDGDQVGGASALQVNTADTRQVLVSFGATTLDNAAGASVEDSAVTSGLTARANEEDEVGAAGGTATEVTPGRTDGPDLTAVALNRQQNAFGQTTGYTAVYTFDEDVNDVGVVANNFFLYQNDGTRLVCTGQTAAADRTEDQDNTITCTSFAVGTPGGAVADLVTQVGAAVAGTVQDGAVDDEEAGTNLNPEGYEVATDGTGTARQG